MLSKTLRIIHKLFIYLLTPLHLFSVLIFFISNKKLLNNNVIFPFFTWSFGHQIIAYDIASRTHYNNKISLIEINHPRNNEYLSECYVNLEQYKFDSIFFPKKHPSNIENFTISV